MRSPSGPSGGPVLLRPPLLLALFLVLAAVVFGAAWLDYRQHRETLLRVMREEAEALAMATARAAENGLAGYRAWENELVRRLHTVAHELELLDHAGQLDRSVLQEVAAHEGVFRMRVFDTAGREILSNRPPAEGRGRGRDDSEGGEEPGFVADFLASSEPSRLVGFHEARHQEETRFALLVRRRAGGAWLFGLEATEMLGFRRAIGADRAIHEIGQLPGVAFSVLEDRAGVLAFSHGSWDVPFPHQDPFIDAMLERGGSASRVVEIQSGQGERVLELLEAVASLSVPGGGPAVVRVGLRTETLDAARSAFLRGLLLRGFVFLVIGAGVLVFLSVLTSRRVLAEEADRMRNELRALEEERSRKEKLTAMGVLARGVAHEIRNPLNALRMVAQRLAREFKPTEDEPEYQQLTGAVVGEVDRIAGIVEEFLRFARPPRAQRSPTDLNAVVEHQLASFESQAAARGVQVSFVKQTLPPVLLDPELLRQALLNLLVNALDANAEGGRIVVRTRRQQDAALLEVEDDGVGMDEETRARIWDLYFSTKETGTGMGLPTVHRIATEHGGRVELWSEPGRGARFTLHLPLGTP